MEEKPPLIGILHSLRGSLASCERPLIEAALMAVDEINAAGGVLGKKIMTLIEDGASDPDQFSERAQWLIQKMQVVSLFGCWSSASRKAVKRVVERHQVPLWYPAQYEGLEESPWIIYSGACFNQQVLPALDWLWQQGKRDFYLVGSEGVFSRSLHLQVRQYVQILGGRILQERLWDSAHLPPEDLAAEIMAHRPEAILNSVLGKDNLALFQACHQAGLDPARHPILSFTLDENFLPQLGSSAWEHLVCWSHFAGQGPPEVAAFEKAFQARYGSDRVVTESMLLAHGQIYLWKHAVEKAHSFHPTPMMAQAVGSCYDSAMGRLEIQANHHLKKWPLIGRIQPDGKITPVWQGELCLPEPWLGLEGLASPFREMILNLLQEVTEGTYSHWLLEREIRRQKDTRKALEESESRLEVAQEVANMGHWTWEVDNGRVAWSPHFFRILGLPPSKKPVDEHLFFQFVHPADHDRIRTWAYQAFKDKSHYVQTQHRILRQDGEVRNVELRGHLFWDQDQRVRRVLGTLQDITENQRTQQQLLLQGTIISAMDEGVCLVDQTQGLILLVNESFCRIYGYAQAEMVGHPLSMVQPKNTRTDLMQLLLPPQGEAGSNQTEFLAQRKDGSLFWASLRLSSFHHHELGQVWIGLSADITKAKQDSERLRRSEARHRALVEAIPDLLFRTDAQGLVLDFKADRMGLLHFAEEDVLGLSVFVLFPDDLQQLFHQKLEEALQSQEQVSLEFQLKIPKGQRYFEVRIKASGSQEVLWILREVTQQRQALLDLKESEARNRALVQAIPDLMFRIDHQGTFLDFKASQEGDLLVPADQIIGSQVSDLLPPDLAALTSKHTQAALSTGQIQSYQYQAPTPAGMQYFEARVNPVGGGEVFAIVRNITPLKQKELELEEAKLHAEEANRAKSNFLAMMSHELRTPLNGILGLTELMLLDALSDKHHRYVEIIHNSGSGLLGTVNDILDLSRIEAGRMEMVLTDFALGELVEQLNLLFNASAQKKNLALDWRLEAGLPKRVRGDREHLSKILTNLVGNAIKFTLEGEVTISIRLAQATPEGWNLAFEVKDTGIGIDPLQQEAIFQPFTQADSSATRAFGGTGLGLAIVQSLVEQMGGSISLQSQLGQGSCFDLVLPFDHPATQDQALVPELLEGVSLAPGKQESLRVLVVEDEASNREVVSTQLQELGCAVQLAQTGFQALEFLDHYHPDLILMDLIMPELDGLETTRRIRQWEADQQKAPHLIFALTARAMKEDQEACMAAGMNGFLTKPLGLEVLSRTLRQAHRQRALGGDQPPLAPSNAGGIEHGA